MMETSMPLEQKAIPAQPLRLPLLLNAVFSGVNGLLLLCASPMVATWLGPQATWIYTVLGSGLLLFVVILSTAAVRPTPVGSLAITGADVMWVIFTTTSLFIWRDHFTSLGWGLVLGTNAVVLALVWYQQRAIRTVFQAPGCEQDEYHVCIAVDTPVAADAFWKVLADLGAIHRYMPTLRSSVITMGETPGVGCIRTCEDVNGQVWSEQCEQWDEGRSFSVAFVTDSPSFPFPFSKMRGGWRVTPKVVGCRVEVWWRVVPQRPVMASVLLTLMATSAQRSFVGVIERMGDAALKRTRDSATPFAIPRLHAVLC